MSFLAPLFLFGTLAVALPVIFHLIRRTTRERVPFSSLAFLLPSPPRLTRRSKLEHLLLLALRCLALCLLAFGFARPFLKQAVPASQASVQTRQLAVLVDVSASMRRADWWSLALAKAEVVLRQTTAADQVALYTFDRQLHPLVTFEQWNATPAPDRATLALGHLKATTPGWLATELGLALAATAETLADTAGKPATSIRRIVLISDLPEGCRLEPLQGYDWPKGVELVIESLKGRRTSNAALQLAVETDDSARKPDASLRLRISNAPDAKREQFKAGWTLSSGQAFSGTPVDLYVPPGQSRIFSLPLPAAAKGERITLQGDDEDFDNTLFVIPPEPTRYSVIYLGQETEKDIRQPRYFLDRAFQETRRQAVRVTAPPAETVLTASEAQAATLFVAAGALPAGQTSLIREQIRAGKSMLIALKDIPSAATLSGVLGVEGLTAEEIRPDQYAMFAEVDFHHPLFAPFADPRFSDFTKIHFWRYRELDPQAIPGARVLAKFDTGDPALMEVPLGQGRVYVLASGWHPEDSQLALSSKFVPLLYAMLEQAGSLNSPLPQYHVGDTIPCRTIFPAAGAAFKIHGPDGKIISISPGETNFTQAMVPGIYLAESGQTNRPFAVNLDPMESRTAPLVLEELERLGAPVKQPSQPLLVDGQRLTRLQNSELENRQKLWRWLIVATLAILLLETWWAGRTVRRSTVQSEAAI